MLSLSVLTANEKDGKSSSAPSHVLISACPSLGPWASAWTRHSKSSNPLGSIGLKYDPVLKALANTLHVVALSSYLRGAFSLRGCGDRYIAKSTCLTLVIL